MEHAMDDVTNDTGRSLAPITGLISCPLYSGFWHFIIGIPYILISIRRKKITGEDIASDGDKLPFHRG
jgi:hypothetical protein